MGRKAVWLTSLSLGILSTSVVVTTLIGQTKVAQGCVNFWINPQTGQRECLDRQTSPSSPSTTNSPTTGESGSSRPSGRQAQNRDQAIVNNRSSAAISERQIREAIPHINSLSAPNTDAVRPARQLQNAQGAQSIAADDNAADDNTEPRAFGSFSVPYTAARVSHLPTGNVASTNGGYLSATYPYRTIGRLTFQDGSFSFTCSASLIRRSVIVTAAHCIQNFGSGRDTFERWTFTPAFYDGNAPYGSWNWAVMVRPSSWANGTDTGSGAARNNDLAVIALGKNSSNQFIGDITGWLTYGWNNYSFVSHPRTGNLAVAALSALGYPGLLDQGRIMQRTDGPSYLTTISGADQIYQGSTFTGGSSGGPWIANFKYEDPVFSSGAGPGDAPVNNVIVGVTSWGAADPNTPKDNYSSQFGQNSEYPNASYGTYGAGNIGSLLNTLCSFVSGGSTLADQGYCD